MPAVATGTTLLYWWLPSLLDSGVLVGQVELTDDPNAEKVMAHYFDKSWQMLLLSLPLDFCLKNSRFYSHDFLQDANFDVSALSTL